MLSAAADIKKRLESKRFKPLFALPAGPVFCLYISKSMPRASGHFVLYGIWSGGDEKECEARLTGRGNPTAEKMRSILAERVVHFSSLGKYDCLLSGFSLSICRCLGGIAGHMRRSNIGGRWIDMISVFPIGPPNEKPTIYPAQMLLSGFKMVIAGDKAAPHCMAAFGKGLVDSAESQNADRLLRV